MLFSQPTAVVRHAGYVCNSCARTLRRTSRISGQIVLHRKQSTDGPFVGIIGSGPAGFYAATKILEKNQNARVDMYEQLPTPFGLVRYGVAPDHPEVKVANSSRFMFIGNVQVGRGVPLNVLKKSYDALLFAYGASEDKPLGVPGEHLDGVLSARAFVGWYNGLPEFRDLNPPLDIDDTAHIIGNGNVALDIARILLSTPNQLRETDMPEYALSALSKSTIRHVKIYGRRGPMQATFTIKEVRELLRMHDVGFHPVASTLLPTPQLISVLPRVEQRRFRLADLLRQGSPHPPEETSRSWSLEALQSPTSFSSSTSHVETMTLTRNAYKSRDGFFLTGAKVSPTSEKLTVPAKLVFRSIGYKSTALPGMRETFEVEFAENNGTIPNDKEGRVTGRPAAILRVRRQMKAVPLPGLYCAGWVKNGPTGVIASTMEDAFESANALLQDWEKGKAFLNKSGHVPGGWQQVVRMLVSEGLEVPEWVSWDRWLKIEFAERRNGAAEGRRNVKFGTLGELMAAARNDAAPTRLDEL